MGFTTNLFSKKTGLLSFYVRREFIQFFSVLSFFPSEGDPDTDLILLRPWNSETRKISKKSGTFFFFQKLKKIESGKKWDVMIFLIFRFSLLIEQTLEVQFDIEVTKICILPPTLEKLLNTRNFFFRNSFDPSNRFTFTGLGQFLHFWIFRPVAVIFVFVN